jgi:ABC-type Fe3+/spermidine/putrescine transport system ATPase subunit
MATETPATALTAREILNETGAPVVVFDHVQLAFDDKVVLKDISFTLIKGHTKIILGASGSGKSTVLKIVVGLLRADAGVVWVNGNRVDQMTEDELMDVRNDLGMIFQEGALFDSLTVRENVGYKLYEETCRSRKWTSGWKRCSASSASPSTSTRCRRSSRAASGGASRSRARWRSSRASCCTTKRRPASIRSRRPPWTTR